MKAMFAGVACAALVLGGAAQPPAKPTPPTSPVPPASPAPVQPAQATVFNFDKDAPGKLPDGWKAEGTNQRGPVATWEVASDETAPSAPKVLALTKTNHDSGDTFNICWTDRVRFTDGAIEVKFKAVSGQEDQGGGIIWRVKDKDNYMVARMNPLEDNFRVYYVKDGSRKQLASANVKAAAGAWHAMKIVHNGDHAECSLDGKKLLDVKDDHIKAEGGVGVWTKADAVTSFDVLTIGPPPGAMDPKRDAPADKGADPKK